MAKKGKDEEGAIAGEERLYSRFSEEIGLFVNLTTHGDMVKSVRLSERLPSATLGADNVHLARIIDHIASGKDEMLDIPLEYQGTPFERGVQEQLRKIPLGEVATYGEIARRLGRPKASRAVGSACAKNPYAILVPCHRVVPSSGGVGNYTSAGGSDVKIRLLESEGAISKASVGRKNQG